MHQPQCKSKKLRQAHCLEVTLRLFLSRPGQDFNPVIEPYQPAHAVLQSVKEKLAAATAGNAPPRQNMLDVISGILVIGRGYSWMGIYLAVEDNTGGEDRSEAAPAGSDPGSDAARPARFPETKREMVIPIKVGVRKLGMIAVESDRANGLSRQERVLLGQVAAAIAQYLTTGPGKLLLRKAREHSARAVAASQRQKGPQSARPEKSRAAAGEHFTR